MSSDQHAEVQEEKDTIFSQAREYVRSRFNEALDPIYLFHNFAYSEEIADKAGELAKKAELDEEQIDRLRIAGLFYPLGYIGGPKDFAHRSADELNAFATQHGYNAGDAPNWITAVPDADAKSDKMVRLLHDAVWNWLGRKRYERRSELLQLEREALDSKKGGPVVFGQEMQKFLLNFNYLSDEGKREFDVRRRKNVSKQQSNNYKIQQKEVKAKTGKNFGRGIDTMYRTAFRNHINLSRIADDKANMMISINTIILSILIAVSGAGLSFFEELVFNSPEFLAPIVILLMSSLTAVIFAVFSARPKVTEYRIKKRKLLQSKEASLLYFGNFLKLEKSDFIRYMSRMKMDQDSLYDDLARDLYDLGQVLHRKYLLLTISYNTFIGGLALAVLTFLTVYIWNLTNMQ